MGQGKQAGEIKNLESVNASYSSQCQRAQREISTLEEEVNSLNNQITQHKAEIDRLQKERDQAISDKVQGDTALRKKIDYINILKENADIEFGPAGHFGQRR